MQSLIQQLNEEVTQLSVNVKNETFQLLSSASDTLEQVTEDANRTDAQAPAACVPMGEDVILWWLQQQWFQILFTAQEPQFGQRVKAFRKQVVATNNETIVNWFTRAGLAIDHATQAVKVLQESSARDWLQNQWLEIIAIREDVPLFEQKVATFMDRIFATKNEIIIGWFTSEFTKLLPAEDLSLEQKTPSEAQVNSA